MSYILLAPSKNFDNEAQLEAFSLATLTPKNKLSIFDCREGFYSKKDAVKMSIEELIGYFTYHYFNCATSIIKHKDKLESDKHLIKLYGEKYLGCSNTNFKKADLIPYVDIFKNYNNVASYYKNWLNPPMPHLYNALEKCNFNKVDLKNIEDKRIQVAKPLVSDIEKKLSTYKNGINKLPKLFLRNF